MSMKRMKKKVSDQPVRQASRQERKRAQYTSHSQRRKSAKNSQTAQPGKRKQHKRKRKEEKKQHKKPRRRLIPIWLRLIIFLLLCAAVAVAGLMIGFGVLGDGNARDVLDKATWQHIIDIVVKER